MEIVFVNPNTYQGNPRPPLGLLSLATVCLNAGHDATILDANLEQLDDEGVVHYIFHRGCDVVALTAMTPTINEALGIAGLLRAIMPEVKIIIGGVHASIFPEDLAAKEYIDAVIVGAGEHNILRVLDELPSPKQVYRQELPLDLDRLPLPDYSLIDVLAYHPRYPHGKHREWTSVQTSRGCPYSCTFCSKAVFGNTYHAMSPARVVELLSGLQRDYGIRDITFYDDLFTMDRGRTLALCDWMIPLGLTWVCEARVNQVDLESLEAMKAAGCRMIFYGIESGSQAILDRLKKNVTLQQIKQAVRWTQAEGIGAAGYFMLGCPGETKDTINETMDFVGELHLGHAQFSVCSPLPGSALYQEYQPTMGWEYYQYLGGKKCLIPSDDLTEDEIEEAVAKGNGLFCEKVV